MKILLLAILSLPFFGCVRSRPAIQASTDSQSKCFGVQEWRQFKVGMTKRQAITLVSIFSGSRTFDEHGNTSDWLRPSDDELEMNIWTIEGPYNKFAGSVEKAQLVFLDGSLREIYRFTMQ